MSNRNSLELSFDIADVMLSRAIATTRHGDTPERDWWIDPLIRSVEANPLRTNSDDFRRAVVKHLGTAKRMVMAGDFDTALSIVRGARTSLFG